MKNFAGFDPMEFCDACFQRQKTVLCETHKDTFAKISSIHFSQQSKLDRLLNRLGLLPRMVERRWTCAVGPESRKEFLDSLWGIGITVHTLEDHLKVLSRLYRPESRPLGVRLSVDLPVQDLWEEFDPKSRSWTPLSTGSGNGKLHAEANLGNILKTSGIEGTSYFRINKDGDAVAAIPMERRAALNIASTISQPTTVNWKADLRGDRAIIDLKDLEVIPDEIMNFLKRLGKKDKKFPGMIIFENGDLDMVDEGLGLIKIHLAKSEGTVDLGASGRADEPVPLGAIQAERLSTFLEVIKEMGGTVTSGGGTIVISGNRGSATVTFTENDRSVQDGASIQVSASALEDPQRCAEVLSAMRKKVGLLDVSLDALLASRWPVLNDSDLQYVIQSAVSWYGSNPALAQRIIGGPEKLPKIRDWHSRIKKGEIRSALDTITLGKIIKRLETDGAH